jgi:uncharacterized repeat protein (TIGR02543 family)
MNAPKTAIANWQTQYNLTVVSPYDTPIGEGWYDEGTRASVSTDQCVDIVPGSSRYRFAGWTTGDISEIADPSSPSTTVLMDKAKTVTANYVIQYYLTVQSDHGTTSGENWYDEGATAYAGVSPLTVPGDAGVQYVFTQWSGDATGATSPSDPITMNGPKTAIANWQTLYLVEIVGVTPCDTVGNPKTNFASGALAYFKVVVNNTGLEPVNVLITVNIYDSMGTTIGVASFQGPIMPGITTIILGLPVPTTARLGEAKVYANAFTDWIHKGGVPYCPEKSATFTIVK